MIRRPKFKEHLRAEVLSPDRLTLLTEYSPIEIEGRIFALLAPFLDGQHTFSDIVDAVKAEATVLDVVYGLQLLQEQGHIVEGRETLPTAYSAFRDLLGVSEEEFESRLKNTRVRVCSFGSVSDQVFIETLTSLNIRVEDDGELWVALTDDYLRPGLDELSREAERHKRSWMLVKPVGAVLWFGPIFLPDSSPCFECLTKRLEENGTAPPSDLASTFRAGVNMAATQVFTWILKDHREPLERRIVTWDALSMETTYHVVPKHPRCRRCVTVSSPVAPKPLLLQSRPKVFTSDGGHRAVLPEQTLQNLLLHVSPITGIVPKLQFHPIHSNGLIQVFVTDWPVGRIGSAAFRFVLRNKCAGKGATRVQAQVSALCEALERYSGIFQGNEIRTTASFRQLGRDAIHPNMCMNFSEQQYARRATWNAVHPPLLRVPEPFDEDVEIEWSPLWSLTEEKFKYLPTAYCYFGYPATGGRIYCGADSNGNAAGNTLEEAVLQGFMEVAERDSASIWWYNQSQRPAVDLESFDQAYFRALKKHYEGLGRDLSVLDITSDLGIPTFAAVSRRGGQREILGFGAHFSAELAILRALTELNQFLPTAKGDVLKHAELITSVASLDRTWLRPHAAARARRRDDFRDLSSEDLHQDIMSCVRIAKEHGLETLVLDQTRPEVGLHVVKVVVPGLRSWWARFGPGRLYDVPVSAGWRDRPLREDDLNPRHILL